MSLDYNLYIKGKIRLKEITESTIKSKNVNIVPEVYEKRIEFDLTSNFGFFIQIYFTEKKYFDYVGIDSKEVEFEWSDLSTMAFRIEKNQNDTEYLGVKRNMLDFVVHVLKNTNEDVLFLLNNDVLVFERNGNKLSFNSDLFPIEEKQVLEILQ